MKSGFLLANGFTNGYEIRPECPMTPIPCRNEKATPCLAGVGGSLVHLGYEYLAPRLDLSSSLDDGRYSLV